MSSVKYVNWQSLKLTMITILTYSAKNLPDVDGCEHSAYLVLSALILLLNRAQVTSKAFFRLNIFLNLLGVRNLAQLRSFSC